MPRMISVLSIQNAASLSQTAGARAANLSAKFVCNLFSGLVAGCFFWVIVLIIFHVSYKYHVNWFITDFFFTVGGVGVQGRAISISAR